MPIYEAIMRGAKTSHPSPLFVAVAERVRFELTVALRLRRFSRPVP